MTGKWAVAIDLNYQHGVILAAPGHKNHLKKVRKSNDRNVEI